MLFDLKAAEAAIAILPRLEKVAFVIGNEVEDYQNHLFDAVILENFPLLAAKGLLDDTGF